MVISNYNDILANFGSKLEYASYCLKDKKNCEEIYLDSVISIAKFSKKAKNIENLVDCDGTYLLIHSVPTNENSSESIPHNHNQLMVIINNYLLDGKYNAFKGRKDERDYKEKFIDFLEDLRRISSEILKSPSMRLGHQHTYINNSLKNYNSFTDYLSSGEAEEKLRDEEQNINELWETEQVKPLN